jgi:hypothetical protein
VIEKYAVHLDISSITILIKTTQALISLRRDHLNDPINIILIHPEKNIKHAVTEGITRKGLNNNTGSIIGMNRADLLERRSIPTMKKSISTFEVKNTDRNN